MTTANGKPTTITIPKNVRLVEPQPKKGTSAPKGRLQVKYHVGYIITPDDYVFPAVDAMSLLQLGNEERIINDAIESGWCPADSKVWFPFTICSDLHKVTYSSNDDTKYRKRLQEACFGRVHKDGKVSPPKTENIKQAYADILLRNKSVPWFKENCTTLDDTNIAKEFPRLNEFIRSVAKPLPPYKKLDAVFAELTAGAARDSDDDDDDDDDDDGSGSEGDDSKDGEKKKKKKKGGNGGKGHTPKKPKPTINKKSSKEEKDDFVIVLNGFGHPKNVQGKKKTLHTLAMAAMNAALEQGRVEM